MNTLQADLDAAIPDAPLLPELEDTLRAGRASLRRRRQGTASGLVAAVVVVSVAVMAVGGGGTDEAVTPADQTIEPVPTPTDTYAFGDGDLVGYDLDGVLRVRPGVQVVRRWDNPMELPAPGRSVAMVVERAGTTYWTLNVWDGGISDDWDGGGTAASIGIEPREAHGLPFERWVQDEMPRQGIGWPNPDFVTLQADGRLIPVDDATILAQTSDAPRLVPQQAESVAVALVQSGPGQLCVAAAQAPGRAPEYVYLAASTFGPDLAGCVATMPRWDIRP